MNEVAPWKTWRLGMLAMWGWVSLRHPKLCHLPYKMFGFSIGKFGIAFVRYDK